MPMTARPNRRELFALVGIVLAAGAWMLLPEIRQPQAYHSFADQRVFMGVPHAADVLSNLAFVAVAVRELWRLGGTVIPLAQVVRVGLLVFFAGNFLAVSGPRITTGIPMTRLWLGTVWG